MRDLIAPILSQKLIEFGDFMLSCAKTPSFLMGYDREKVKVEESCGAFVFSYTDIWASNEKDLTSIFKNENEDEKLISVKILDIPLLHTYDSKLREESIYY